LFVKIRIFGDLLLEMNQAMPPRILGGLSILRRQTWYTANRLSTRLGTKLGKAAEG
jgi:hypothetical protein